MRGGRKKRPFYRIVAAHSAFKRDGRFLEKVGTYDPLAADGNQVTLKEDRIMYWLGKGAQPTDTAHNIFSQAGIMLRHDMTKRNKFSDEEIDKAVAELKGSNDKKTSEKAAKEAKKIADAKKAEEKALKDAAKAEADAAKAEEEAAAKAEAEAAKAAEEAAKAEETPAEEAPAEEEAKTEEAPAEEKKSEDA